MTYSIVAFDRATGSFGAAVQSHFLGVGALCPAVRAGVGAVCSQATVEPAHRQRVLDGLAAGLDAPTALAASLAADDGEAHRQVGVVDASGRAAAHTGKTTISEAGHVTGDGYAAQANMMWRAGVPEAMGAAYEAALEAGQSLSLRLIAALDAAEEAGGDIRGRQSAALLVVGPDPTAFADGLVYDLRVDDHPDPLAELRRIHTMRCGFIAPTAEALEAFAEASGGNPELSFWTGVALAASGQVDEARPHIAAAVANGDGWVELLPRLQATGQLPDDPELIARLLS